MKQTIRTSRTAGQLEKMFRAINAHFYNNELPEPIITLKKTPNAYGHITCSKTWQAGSERRYEINISTATLDRPIDETTATLCHECAHLYALTHGIKDTSGSGNSYHNKRFKAIAEATVLLLTTTRNTAGPLQAHRWNCWTSSRLKAGKLFKCSRG
ncbi:MAG: SprT-like domain-containing protein [Subdoligranulum variabile]|nr:SprT-like domain-containing protein [Subdoligranulum variabile]